MNSRLQQFLLAENISQSQFADTIGVARASVSHIIAGRNKPGFDFIDSMLKQFPSLNIEWLITGKGKMYRTSAMAEIPAPAPAPVQQQEPEPEDVEIISEDIVQEAEEPSAIETVQQDETSSQTPAASGQKTAQKPRRIEKIVIFYDDSTFQEIKA